MKHQKRINEYYQEILQHGHNMHSFHANWHRQNSDPQRPVRPDRNWGTDIAFGQKFLQMHHEMVKAKDDEQKTFMHHQSLVEWYKDKGYDLPQEWNPLTIIPDDLNHIPEPDTLTLPDGRIFSLKRATNNPGFQLPKWFTVTGISANERGEPLTGARKLGDFININQLGCCLVFPHNVWHGTIEGSMSFTTTAINDPIFFFGVHWHIDKVYDAYQALIKQIEPSLKTFEKIKDFSFEIEKEAIQVPNEFTEKELSFLNRAEELGKFARQEVKL